MFNISLLCVQGAIAKKPYNPILGETFRCYWDLPDGRRKPPDEESKVCIPIPPLPLPSNLSLSLSLFPSFFPSLPVSLRVCCRVDQCRMPAIAQWHL